MTSVGSSQVANHSQECLLDSSVSIKNPSSKRYISQRFIIATVNVVGCMILYFTRINLSVAMVAMVNGTYVAEHDQKTDGNKTHHDTCPNLERGNTSTNFEEGEFKWDQNTQGIILSSFFYGYVVSQIPGGILADKYGAKHVIGLSVLLSSVLSLLTPVSARLNLYVLIAVRVVEGILQGVMYPAITSLMAAWSPINERSLMIMAPNFGIYIGIIIAFPITGILCEKGFAGGWPSAFYVFGLTGLVWYPSWLYLISNSPKTHPRISKEERDYIMQGQPTGTHVKLVVPWVKILTSIPVWSTLIAMAGGSLGYGALLTFLPTYLNEVLKFDIISGGAVSVAPYISAAIATVIGGWLGDFLSVKLRNVTASRKIMTVLSNVLSGVLLVCTSLAGCSRLGVITFLTTSVFCLALNSGGVLVNPIDLAPQFSGVITGVCNTAGTIAMILGPYITGALTNDAQTLETWAQVFYVLGGVSIVSGLIYLIFGSGKLQSWAVTSQEVIINECDTASHDNRAY